MKASIYFNYTSRSLIRGGQRTVLAIFCVAVGVMAIVALQLVGLMINNAFNSNVRDANGGDIAVSSQNQPFTASDLPYFDTLKKNGSITDYTPVINATGFNSANVSLRESFTVRVVDPRNYPVVTAPDFTNPTNGTITNLLKDNQVIVTQPFIDQYKKKVGDHFDFHINTRGQGGRIIHAKLVGIVTESGVLAQAGNVVLLAVDDYKNAEVQKSSTTTPQGTPVAGGTASQTAPQGNGTENQTPPPGNSGAGQAAPPNSGAPTTTDGTTGSQPVSNPKDAIYYNNIDVSVSASHLDAAVKKIQSQFPIASIQTAADALKQQQVTIDNIRKFLEIAGLLALLIGGVGIVNTMQVLLSRRRTEIAMLKTTGYRRFDLYLLFGLEAGLLGLLGGLLGAAAATGVSYLVRNLVQETFKLNIPFLLDWITIGGGVVIGLVTALIFGLLPIVQAANIRPLNVIRDMPEGRSASSIALTLGLLLILSVLFCALAIVILNNDVVLGLVSVYGTFLFLALLSVFFGLIIFLISRLPVPEHFSPTYLALVLAVVAVSALIYWLQPAFGVLFLVASLLGFLVVIFPRTWKATVKMALRNLGRQRTRTTTTMLALFVGIFTIGLILILGQNLREQVSNLIATSLNYNVFVISSNDDTTKLQDKLGSVPGLSSYQHRTLASTSPVSINDKPIKDFLPTGSKGAPSSQSLGRSGALYFLSGVEGYDVGNNQVPSTSFMHVIAGRNLSIADAGTNNVLVSYQLAQLDPFHLKIGDKIMLTGIDRLSSRTVNIVGIYHNNSALGSGLYPIMGTNDTVNALSPVGIKQAIFYMKIDTAKLNQATDLIGNTIPNAFVLNLANISSFIEQLLNDVLLTLTTIASLSLVAGVVIIANAVALAMLERQRELGILKSVGYTSRTILSEVLLENGLVGGTGALLAMVLVAVVTSLLGSYVFKSNFSIDTVTVIELILGSALLAMLTAALVAWGAVRVRPLEVLRYE